MRRVAALLLVLTTALPAAAQDADSAMERGLRLFLDGLRTEMEPALRDLEGLAQDAAPFLREMQRSLGEVVEDFDVYDAPEVLPNGDIIIRRKTPLDTPVPDDLPPLPSDEGAIDL